MVTGFGRAGAPMAAMALMVAVSSAPGQSAAPPAARRPPMLKGHLIQNLASDLPPQPASGAVATGLARAYGGSPISVTTYHYDTLRTGWNPAETDLTVANVVKGRFGLIASLPVDGLVLAQPLLAAGVEMADDSEHDVLIVATEHNSVYAFDARSYARLWQVSLGPSQSSLDVGCADVQPEYGISSTPVIAADEGAGRRVLYVVSATETAGPTFQTQLHALDLATGQDLRPPAVIAPSGSLSTGGTVAFSPQNQWNRAGLAWNAGSIYVGVGGHCDNDAALTTGWLLRYDSALTPLSAFQSIRQPTAYWLGSVWMSGVAPAIDASGNVFVATGNGAYSGATSQNWSMSVIRLPADLSAVTSSFTPAGYAQLNAQDFDLGAGGVLLLPPVAGQTAPPLAVIEGKWPQLYLLNQNSLGGLSAGDGGALQAQRAGKAKSNFGLWGAPTFFNGSSGPMVFLQTYGDLLKGYSVSAGAAPALTLALQGTTPAGKGGSLSVVSSNGAAPGTGVVWVLRRTVPPALEAYDAARLGAPIWRATAGAWPSGPTGQIILTPMEANGRVYVGSSKVVDVFGLLK